MQISFQQVNPHAGNQSILLRCRNSEASHPVCILIDAGHEINLSEQLTGEDELAAILLTHAHADHYQSLSECVRPETTLYSSEPTADALDAVLELAGRQSDNSQLEVPEDRQGIRSWTDIAPGISVHPVPAGHAPGAIGYLIRFEDGSVRHHLLATGDFTRRRAAGYPSFDDSIAEVDVLLLTVATNNTFSEHLSEGLGQALQRAHAGAETLLATTGLLGVQATYLLSELITTLEIPITVRPAGQVARLYEALSYQCQHVEPVPVFEQTNECLDPGVITVAGPESPTEGASGRLFDALQDTPDACLVQLYNNHSAPVSDATCTVDSYRVVNHPSLETIDEVQSKIDPTHTLILHNHRGGADEFNYMPGCVWSPSDTTEYTLYQEGWKKPPWMGGGVLSKQAASSVATRVGDTLVDAFTLPQVDRHETVDLVAEGVDVERVRAIVKQVGVATPVQSGNGNEFSSKYTTDSNPEDGTVRSAGTPESADSQSSQPPTESGVTSAETTDESTEVQAETPSETVETSSVGDTLTPTSSQHPLLSLIDSNDCYGTDGSLIDTVGKEFKRIDPQLQVALNSGELKQSDIRTIIKLCAEWKPKKATESIASDTESGTNSSAEVNDQEPGLKTGSDSSDDTDNDDDSTAVKTDNDSVSEADTIPTDSSSEAATPDQSGDDNCSEESVGDSSEPGHTDFSGSEQLNVTLCALTVEVAEQIVDSSDASDIETVVARAIDAYLRDVLAGDADPPTQSSASLSIDVEPPFRTALEVVLNITGEDTTLDDVVSDHLGHSLGNEARSISLSVSKRQRSFLDAILMNEATTVSSREDVIAVAVYHHLSVKHST